jgi:hypothetical protein
VLSRGGHRACPVDGEGQTSLAAVADAGQQANLGCILGEGDSISATASVVLGSQAQRGL